MSTFEDVTGFSSRRRLFSSRLRRRRRRLRGRHILGGVLIAGVATAALSVGTGHHGASPTPPPSADIAPARFSTVQQPVEQLLAEPQAAAAAPVELSPLLLAAAPASAASIASPAERDSAVLDAGRGTGRITTGSVPLSAATRWVPTPELAQAATAADTAAVAAPEPATEPTAAAAAASAPAAAKPPTKPVTTPHAASASGGGQTRPVPAGATAPSASGAAGAWRIQLAAARTETAANDAWGRLKRTHPELLGTLTPTTSRAVLDGAGPVFRLQAGEFRDRGGADRLCSALKRHHVACLVIRPR
jgi:cell division septation protein DedD